MRSERILSMIQTTAYSTIDDPILQDILRSNDGLLKVSTGNNMEIGHIIYHPAFQYAQANQETLDYLELTPNFP